MLLELPLPALLAHQPGSFRLPVSSHPTARPLLRAGQMLHPRLPVPPFAIHAGHLQRLLQPDGDVGGHALDLPPPPELPSRIVLREGVGLGPGELPGLDRAPNDRVPLAGRGQVVGVAAVGQGGRDGRSGGLPVILGLVQAGLRGIDPATPVPQRIEGRLAVSLAAFAAADLSALMQRTQDHFLPQLAELALLRGLLQRRHQVLHQLIHHGAEDETDGGNVLRV